jgi:integrase
VRRAGEVVEPSHSAGRILDEAEIGRLLAEAGDTFRPFVALLIFSGLRIGEALGLTWADVDFEAGSSESGRSSTDRGSESRSRRLTPGAGTSCSCPS